MKKTYHMIYKRKKLCVIGSPLSRQAKIYQRGIFLSKSKWSAEFRAKISQEYLDGKGLVDYLFFIPDKPVALL